jgi:predicted nuclease with TOPRIM domain
MRTHRRKVKRGGLFGLTRTSKYKNVKASNEELQNQNQQLLDTITEKNKEIDSLHEKLNEKERLLNTAERNFRTYEKSNPPLSTYTPLQLNALLKNQGLSLKENQELPLKENQCAEGMCTISEGKEGGRKRKHKSHRRKSKGRRY